MAEPWENVVARRTRHLAQAAVCLTVLIMAVLSNGPVGLWSAVLLPIVWLLSWPAIMLIIEVPTAVLLKPVGEKRRAKLTRLTYEALRAHNSEFHPPVHQSTVRDWNVTTDRYGAAHQNLRAAWKDIVRLQGAQCMERECLMSSRRIEAGASWDSWDLAHDHEKGGQHDYLGPAHKLCNQAEALRRGVTWEGAPSLSDLLERAQVVGLRADRFALGVDSRASTADAKRRDSGEEQDRPATFRPVDEEPPF